MATDGAIVVYDLEEYALEGGLFFSGGSYTGLDFAAIDRDDPILDGDVYRSGFVRDEIVAAASDRAYEQFVCAAMVSSDDPLVSDDKILLAAGIDPATTWYDRDTRTYLLRDYPSDA